MSDGKKYELVKDDTIEIGDAILYRIKALRTFSYRNNLVKAGELGGYIQYESNLSQEGNCWIFDNAKVYENAVIKDNVYVMKNAMVYGDSEISGDSTLTDNVSVYGKSKVTGSVILLNNVIIYDSEISDHVLMNKNAIANGAKVCEYAFMTDNSKAYKYSLIKGNSVLYEDAVISNMVNKELIVIEDMKINQLVNTPKFKKLFKFNGLNILNRTINAILTTDNEILYNIGCQVLIDKETFMDRIYNEDGGLEKNPHRQEYLDIIPLIEIYFKKYMKEEK